MLRGNKELKLRSNGLCNGGGKRLLVAVGLGEWRLSGGGLSRGMFLGGLGGCRLWRG